MASVIGWDNTCLLDITKELNESIPGNSARWCVPILDIVNRMDRHELLRLGKKGLYEMDIKECCIFCIHTGAKS